jgi:hypothetical protein
VHYVPAALLSTGGGQRPDTTAAGKKYAAAKSKPSLCRGGWHCSDVLLNVVELRVSVRLRTHTRGASVAFRTASRVRYAVRVGVAGSEGQLMSAANGTVDIPQLLGRSFQTGPIVADSEY